jgi:hypothetical protein
VLGDVKGGGKSVVRLRTGPKGLILEVTEEEKDNILTNLTFSYPDMYPPHSTNAKAAPPYITFKLYFWYLNVLC